MAECIACGENKSDKVDMLAGIKKALDRGKDWTHEYDSADPEAIAEDLWYRCPFCGQTPNKCWCEEERCSECGAFLDDVYEGDLGYCLNCH